MRYKHEFFKVLSTITAISFLYNTFSFTSDVTANEITSDFDPYVFYQEILNEKRPNGAEGYRFLDLDGDGKEELLITGEQNVVMALYSFKDDNGEPINLFMQDSAPPSSYSILSNGMILYHPVRWRSGSYGSFYYRISKGVLQPVIGYYIWIEGPIKAFYKTDNDELLSFPLNSDFSLWENISNEVDSLTETTYNNYVKTNNSNLQIDNEKNIVPWKTTFIIYDMQQEFEKNNKEKPVTISGRYGYDELIQRYKDILSSPSNALALDVTQGTICLNNDRYSYFWKEYSYTEPGFVLTDLNGDGIKEMATGCVEKDGNFKLFDLYTIYENRIIHLAASGWRDTFSISENNEILEGGSSGAADGISMAYELKEGKLKPIRVMSVEKGKFYFYENFGTSSECKTELTNEEWLEKSQTLSKSNHNQNVTLFKDWYPEMRINEDPDGDVNNDGELNILDVILVHKQILSMSGETIVDTTYADINKDNTINVLDLMLLKNLILS